MYRTQIPTPTSVSVSERLPQICSAASDLATRVLNRKATARDLALAVELNQRYLDILDELLDSDLSFQPESVLVALDGQKIRFRNIGDVAEWITSKT
jgi:hypothetical protein